MRTGVALCVAALSLAACATACSQREQVYPDPPPDSHAVRAATLTVDGADREIELAEVDERFFPTLSVAPLLGRLFHGAEFTSADRRTVVLHHALWRDAFGESPMIIGTDVEIDGGTFTVVGVMSPGFDVPPDADVWVTRLELLRVAPGR